jgi:predicted site-specific integrase-resolvase
MYVTSKYACKHYNVSPTTLRRWADKGQINVIQTAGGHRRYELSNIKKEIETKIKKTKNTRQKVIYCRVSSTKQKEDLNRQVKYVQKKHKKHKILTDIGSGINFKRKNFLWILEQVFQKNISEVVVKYIFQMYFASLSDCVTGTPNYLVQLS